MRSVAVAVAILVSASGVGVGVGGSGDTIKATVEKTVPVTENQTAAIDRARGPERPPVGDREQGDQFDPRWLTPGPCHAPLPPFEQWFGDLPVYGPCPSTPGAARPPPPTPLQAAYYAWHWLTRLPKPSLLTSPPDTAITGLDTYLALGGPQSRTIDVTALGHAVHIEVSSVYDVAWGDSAVTRRHATQGGPWPNGDLRHQYTHRGTVTITVTQRWTGRWRASGQSGVLADVLFTTGARTLPVQEIQAVVTG